MRYLVITPIKDQGAFLVEWVAWYRVLGFTDILAVSNNCTDHSPALLDLLQEYGLVTHLRHAVPEGALPLRSAFAAARAHPLVAECDWAMLCDVDEFLVVHRGTGHIGDLLPERTPDFTGMAIHWNCFGSGGLARYVDGPVHRQFRRAGPEHSTANNSFKSIFRDAALFATFGSHGPRGYAGTWGTGARRWIDGRGRTLTRYDPTAFPQRATSASRVTHAAAQMNHYIIRSEEQFAAKRGLPSASAFRDRYNDTFQERYDRNERQDLSADRYADPFDALHSEIMALPGIAHLHHLCCADHVRWLCARLGRDPAADPRLAAHMARAASRP